MSKPVFMFDGSDPEMQAAYEAAKRSFKFFWRELSWERRRIVPALGLAGVKLPFTDGPRTDGKGEFEHMWVDEFDFDGDTISGTLLNSPSWLTSVSQGDAVQVPFNHLTDWMMTSGNRAYGGFTVQVMRSRMSRGERRQHDEAWGLDFGDPATVEVELTRKSKPKGGLLSLFRTGSAPSGASGEFSDHAMCVNMIPRYEEQLSQDSSIATSIDETGWSLLHRDALAGNLGVVRLLIDHGADKKARTPNGYTASELARKIGWNEIADFIST